MRGVHGTARRPNSREKNMTKKKLQKVLWNFVIAWALVNLALDIAIVVLVQFK